MSTELEASTAMTRKRKPAQVAASPAVGRERTPVLHLLVEQEDAFFERVRRRVASSSRKWRSAPSVSTVSFESVGALLAVLTPRRYQLFQFVRQEGPFASIEALATVVKRHRATVGRDVKALSEAGLLVLSDATTPGRGKRTVISVAAAQVKLTLVL